MNTLFIFFLPILVFIYCKHVCKSTYSLQNITIFLVFLSVIENINLNIFSWTTFSNTFSTSDLLCTVFPRYITVYLLQSFLSYFFSAICMLLFIVVLTQKTLFCVLIGFRHRQAISSVPCHLYTVESVQLDKVTQWSWADLCFYYTILDLVFYERLN